ncbi:MAG: YeeE/YedE family protein [Geminicoccaceae bacterium]
MIAQALAGGALIGASAVLLMALQGRIAGISGIVSGLLRTSPRRAERLWRLAFLVGLATGPTLLAPLLSRPAIGQPQVDAVLALVAGLLVGIGTTLGNGCTSGHGVCGLARLSHRSLAATVTFMTVAAITTLALRHMLGGG